MPSFTMSLSTLSMIFAFYAASTSAATSPYAPVNVSCPSTISYIREATELSPVEEVYRTARKAKASTSLKSWLTKIDKSFKVSSTSSLPAIGLASSGGGYRAFLSGAGVIEGFDGREGLTNVSGLYQALTYETALSGGAWLLSSIGASNWQTVAYLRDNIWIAGLNDSLLTLADFEADPAAEVAIGTDLAAKEAAGYPPTLVDIYGRLISYAILAGTDGGVKDTLSEWALFSNFTSANVPFPIMTATGVTNYTADCISGLNSTPYEFSPLEFGSWSPDVHAFTATALLGSSLSNGYAVNGTCTSRYDQLGYVFGTSSNLLNVACLPTTTVGAEVESSLPALEAILEPIHNITERDLYAVYPNPFYKSAYPSAEIAAETDLTLVDGGEGGQSDPLFPLLQPVRGVDVIIVSDNNADLSTNYPNGQQLYDTYVDSLEAGLTKMPVIPAPSVFVAEGLNTRATFFGCNDSSAATIIYLPNTDYVYASGTDTFQVQYTPDETVGLIDNGVAIASQNGSLTWPLCLACGITAKVGSGLTKPSGCAACLTEYCYN